MNRFLKNVGILMLPIILAWMSMEIFYRKVPNNYTYKNELIKTASDSVEVVIFGDSHTFYGLNPKGTYWLKNYRQ